MIVRDSLIYLVGRYGAAILTMVSIAIFTRIVSPEEYGQYALVVSSVFVFYCISLQWLRLSMSRYLPGAGDNSDKLLSQILISALAIIVLAMTMALFVPLVLKRQDVGLYMAGIFLFIAFSSAEILVGVFQAWLEPKVFSVLGLLRIFSATLLGTGLILAGYGALGLIYGAAFGHLTITIIALLRILPRVSLQGFDWRETRKLARFGFVLAIGASLSAAMVFTDRYIVAGLISTEAAGVYSAASDLASRSLLILISAINLAGAPRIFRAYDQGGIAEAEPLLNRQAQILMIVCLPAAVLLVIFTPIVVTTMLGVRYQTAAIDIMPWIVIGSLLQGIRTSYFEFAFSLTKHLWRQAAVLLGAMLVSVMLNYTLIIANGLQGAAMAFAASNLFALVGAVGLGRKILKLPIPTRDIGYTLAGCALVVAIAWPFHTTKSLFTLAGVSFLAATAFGGLLYAADVSAFRPGMQAIARRLGLAAPTKNAPALPGEPHH